MPGPLNMAARAGAGSDLKPYFVKSEGNTRLGGSEHGIDGPLAVSDLQSPNRVSLAYVQGCMDIGMPHNADFNSGTLGRGRPLSDDDPERPPLQRRRGLSEARHGAPQPDGPHRPPRQSHASSRTAAPPALR